MAKPLLPDELWEIVEPLLPPETPKGKGSRGGRPRKSNRKVLTAILFTLKTGIAWEDIPAELGAGHGTTVWRRFDE